LLVEEDAGGVSISPAPVDAPAPPARRTQAERTAQTRAALLDAAVEVLADRGYAHASTTEIANRAGVSRGAQLHHFPTKLDLVSAALDHVFADREADFRRRFAALPADRRTQAGAVAVLWEISRGPTQLAVLELLTAARTDDSLRPLARHVLRGFEAAVVDVFTEILPAAADDPSAAARVRLALAVLQGAALHQHLGLVEQGDELVATLGALAEAFPLGATAPVTPEPGATPTPDTPPPPTPGDLR
jgi:AcrR family transcriptional regulator